MDGVLFPQLWRALRGTGLDKNRVTGLGDLVNPSGVENEKNDNAVFLG